MNSVLVVKRRFALIKDDTIETVIVVPDTDFITQNYPDFEMLEVGDDPGSPGVGWIRVNGVWTEPVPAAPTADQILSRKADAIDFGRNIMAEFSVLNDQRNLSVEQRLSLASMLAPVQSMLLVGDLASVVVVLSGVTPDGVLLTQEILDSFKEKISAFLSSQ